MSTTFKAVKDRAYSTVASGLDNVTDPVTFDVGTSHGVRFPDVAADGEFKISVENEILLCTARATDSLTVSRAQDGTAAAAHANGVAVELRLIASLLDDITTAINDQEDGKYKASAVQSITAVGDAILANSRIVLIDADGNYTLTSTPTIADGINEQTITIINVDAGNTVTLQDETQSAGSNLRLAGTNDLALGPRDSVTLTFSTDLGDWIMTGASDN